MSRTVIRHLPLLRRTAVLGLALGWGAGTVQALIYLSVLDVPNPSAFVSLHLYTGIFAGVGAAALFGLIAHRVGGRDATPLRRLTYRPASRTRPVRLLRTS